jgi:hypothetical protein
VGGRKGGRMGGRREGRKEGGRGTRMGAMPQGASIRCHRDASIGFAYF